VESASGESAAPASAHGVPAATAMSAAAALGEGRQRKNTTKNGTNGESHKLLYGELTSSRERKQDNNVTRLSSSYYFRRDDSLADVTLHMLRDVSE
jgi:hypothetical protein